MKIYYFTSAYDSYGPGTTHSHVGTFLERAIDGEALGIAELLVVANFPTRMPPRATLEQHHEEFHRRLPSLPVTKYQRKKQALSIEFLSQLGLAEDIIGQFRGTAVAWTGPVGPNPKLFRGALMELAEVLRSVAARFEKKPGLKFREFVDEVARAALAAPQSDDDILPLCRRFLVEQSAARDAMSPWERLGIDWSDYHPKAKTLLDDPMFWDPTDDTWFDVLTSFRTWRRRNRQTVPLKFLEKLFRQWGVDERALPAGADEDLAASMRDEAVVALAFALIKTEGVCDDDVRRNALAAIERQIAACADDELKNMSNHLAKLRSKLLEM
jgi:hypothetical protein